MYNMPNNSLMIREIKEADIESIRLWRNQSEIKQYFINNADINKFQQRQWFKNYLTKTDDIMFMVEENINFKKAIGTVALYNINTETKSVEFGRLMIGHLPAQGKGYGKQATILACKYAFTKLDSLEIHLYVLRDNEKAIKLYKNIGFVEKNVDFGTIHMSLNKKALK
ncbi:GNAT family N-acetyltransferase [Bacillus wiedmannii]|uniref:GNAT family N-acetyltransferase n=1 Tax=Bacillus wiedmannii TaxID=1890302 RepID=UPI000BEF86C3|nr:GNAT family N-acetyltransferase [Bacillus wiedmannii]PEO39940.1 hypothetical protein CN555_06455 [Bacillus wiedmannii]